MLNTNNFKYLLEQFADVKIMQFEVQDFNNLSLKQKLLLHYLSEAALCGRDIIFDQFYKHNLSIKRTNEAIITNYCGDENNTEYQNFLVYAKRVWFSNGIHHHYSTDKFYPEISIEYYTKLINNCKAQDLPLNNGESIADFTKRIIPIIFDKNTDNRGIILNDKLDIIKESACNFYEGLTQTEVENFNRSYTQDDESQPIAFGLNSKLVKENKVIKEKVYHVNGMYGKAIEKIIFWLEKAKTVTETEQQSLAITLLIEYYKTGNLKTWDKYNIAWVKELDSSIDFVNGFIENYGDPLGMKATWESVVNIIDKKATERTLIISNNAQWFEDNAPIDSRFRKKTVKGVSAKVINVVQLGGDCYPSTPIGINLPNADWIRKEYGSKSVTMENITFAYDKASQGNGFLQEFCYSQDEFELAKAHGAKASNIHTDLHECLGHGSGQLLDGVSPDALKNYSSALEEARADLFALYYIGHPKTIELGLIENTDVAKAEYNSYIRNGLITQLTRVELGKDIEQAHMRNRQLIARWCYEHGKSENTIELIKSNNKTFVKINNYNKLQYLFATLLAEIQRIKSEGDFKAGKALIENYAIKIDLELHTEVLERFKKLKIAPYGGFINPDLIPIIQNNKIVDVEIKYSGNYLKQMMRYAKEYSFLPHYN